MNTITAIQRRNNRMHAMFDRAAEQDEENKKLPLEYAAGSIGNARRGPVAMLVRGAWGYDDKTGKILAAAPDLLSALESLVQDVVPRLKHSGFYDPEFDPAVVAARAAIAQAKGGI